MVTALYIYGMDTCIVLFLFVNCVVFEILIIIHFVISWVYF